MPDDYTTVGAPDGSQIRFPVSMSDTDIEAAMGKLYPAPAAPPKPSTWEKIKSGASDIAQGVGEGALQPVALTSRLLNKIPYVGETLAPKAGVDALSHIATADPGHPLQNAGQYIPAVASLAEGGAEASAAGKLVPFLKRAATSAIGGAVGSELGGEIGRHIPLVGGPELGEVGEAAGGIAGTLAGGGAFGEKARNVGNPSELPVVGKYFRKVGFPDLVSAPGPLDATGQNIPYAGETTPPVTAGRMPTVEQAAAPAPTVRRTPGQIAPEAVGAPQERVPLTPMTPPTVNLPGGEAMRGPQPLLPASTAPKEASAGLPSVEGPAKPTGTALGRLEGLIREAAGTPELKPNVPLRQQSVGAAGQGFPAVGDSMQNLGGQVSFRREPIIKTVPGLEEGPLRAQAPEKLPAVATEEPARQLGAPPLQPAVPLRQQVKVTGMEPPSRQQTLEQKYPDRELRQLVHANGEDIVDATKDDRETLKAIHDLKNPDVREVAINGGINMVGENGSPIMVNNRKASGDISRQEVFKQLLAKGYTPKQIVDLAKQSP